LKKILVTGGSGFIGTALIKKLLTLNYKVVIIDIKPSSLCHHNLTYIKGNIAIDASYKALNLYGLEIVIHLAAQTSARVSHEEIELNNSSNTLGTLKLIEWAKANKIKRFLFASSMAVYGDAQSNSLVETDDLLPNSYYGISKLAGELALKLAASSGINTTILRLFNVYGPGQDLENLKQGMVSIYLKFLLDNQIVKVTGSLDRYRDFIYIDDVVDAFTKVIENSKTYRQDYNVGSGRKTTVRELIKVLAKGFGYGSEPLPIEQVESHDGDVFGSLSNCNKLQDDTGWQIEWSLESGINEMINWAKKSRSKL